MPFIDTSPISHGVLKEPDGPVLGSPQGITPDLIAGVSIGAVNAAIIAGSPRGGAAPALDAHDSCNKGTLIKLGSASWNGTRLGSVAQIANLTLTSSLVLTRGPGGNPIEERNERAGKTCRGYLLGEEQGFGFAVRYMTRM